MKKEIITIAGTLGSGKSSTANKVAESLGYTRFSSGGFFRDVAVELGLSVDELNKKAETEPEIDYKVDQKVRDIGKESKIVVDSRIAFHWIPESFKVYLSLPPEIANSRILNDLKTNEARRASEHSNTAEEAYANIQTRFQSEQKRYWDLYKIDNTDLAQYDLVIDTNKNNLEEVVAIIVKEYRKWLSK